MDMGVCPHGKNGEKQKWIPCYSVLLAVIIIGFKVFVR